MNWKDLCLLRGSSSALQLKDDFVTSILCGASSHNDVIGSDTIDYVVPNRPFYKKSITLLTNNAINDHPIQVFQKTSVNQWIDKGAFKISNITELSNEIRVSLVAIKT
jgi:hypothetical protein